MSLLDDAAQLMEEATSGFCLAPYAAEGLQDLLARGWTLTPPPTRSWGLFVPGRPLVMNTERRGVWQQRAAETERLVGLTVWLASEARIPRRLAAISCDVTARYQDRRSLPDGAAGATFPAFKAVLDGLVKREVIPDDADAYVKRTTFHPSIVDPAQPMGLLVVIHEENP